MNWRDMPPLSALRAFHAYAESGSMPRAGATLSVSHAAISQQIRNLESFLNVPLLDRTAMQAQLTDEGLVLAKVLSGSFEAISAQVTQMTTTDADQTQTTLWSFPRHRVSRRTDWCQDLRSFA